MDEGTGVTSGVADVAMPVGGGGMDDLLGVFGESGGASSSNGGGLGTSMAGMQSMGGMGGMTDDDLLNGFASMGVANSAPAQPPTQGNGQAKKTNEDLLGLF